MKLFAKCAAAGATTHRVSAFGGPVMRSMKRRRRRRRKKKRRKRWARKRGTHKRC